jgi:hypothetical protein
MLKELFSRDTALNPRISTSFGLGSVFDFSSNVLPITPDQGSWTSAPAGIFLLIKDTSESPNSGSEYYLLIDDSGNRLLIE